jgi:hypothetical protein
VVTSQVPLVSVSSRAARLLVGGRSGTKVSRSDGHVLAELAFRPCSSVSREGGTARVSVIVFFGIKLGRIDRYDDVARERKERMGRVK